MKYSLLLPKERERVLKKDVIEKIEKELGVKIHKNENEVEIEGESLEVLKAINVIKAIANGFSPENAFLLFDENNVLEIIEIPGDKDTRTRIKARIIGKNGLVRRNIERYTNCKVSVYEKTVSIIGPLEKVQIAKEAIEMLISGKKHSTMYKYFEALRKKGILE